MSLMSDEDKEWLAALKAKGHTPILEANGDLDVFAHEFDHHNGPGCSVCWDSWCMHCGGVEQIEPCEGQKKVLPE